MVILDRILIMKNTILLIAALILNCMPAFGQVAITDTNSSPDSSAMLDIQSSDKGVLIPRMTAEQRINISNPATGLLVFDTDSLGFWYYNGAGWQDLSADNKIADADNDTKITVEQNPDEDAIRFEVGGASFAKMDGKTLHLSAPGSSVFIGEDAGLNDLGSDHHHNTFVGHQSGTSNSSGNSNTFLGYGTGRNSTSAFGNTFIGADAGSQMISGSGNIFVGFASGDSTTLGIGNTFVGTASGRSNSLGDDNVYIGSVSGYYNGTGYQNVMIGTRSGLLSSGSRNVFIGNESGTNETESDKLYIDNSSTDQPLIYGDFASNLLRINGKLNINNAYDLPQTDGVEGQILKTNGSGEITWEHPVDVDTLSELLNLETILANGTNAGNHSISNLDTISANSFVGDKIEFPDGSALSTNTGILTIGQGSYRIWQHSDIIPVLDRHTGTYAATDDYGHYILAPVNLPQGVRITKMTVFGYDDDSTKDLNIYLSRRVIAGSGSWSNIHSHTSSGEPGKYSHEINSSHVINNSTYVYMIKVSPVNGNWDSGGSLKVAAVKFEYTME